MLVRVQTGPRRLALVIAVIVLVGAMGTSRTEVARAAAEPPLTATGGPGTTANLDLPRKDCAGTARNGTSKVLWTVADGVLSDVYFPSVDNTNVSTLQYIVTDGSSFTDLQQRDTTYAVHSIDSSGMVCEVTSTAKSGRYQLITDYISDPATNGVVMHTRLVALVGSPSDYHVYARFDGTLNGNGGGGTSNGGGDTSTVDAATGALVSSDTHTTTNFAAANAYRVPVYTALLADKPFLAEESGFVGTPSDGLSELDAGHALGTLYTDAANGNTAQTSQIDTGASGEFTLALDFDQSQAAAVAGAQASAGASFATTQAAYAGGWHAYDAGLNAPPLSFPGLDATQAQGLDAHYYLAANLIKATEDKNFPGAIVSSLGDPWGHNASAAGVSGGNPSLNVNYRVIFERDLYETFTGLLADGDLDTARDTVRFLFTRALPANGEFPRDALVSGAVANDNYAYEPDENAYPIVMAYQAGLASDDGIYPGVKKAADWLVSHGPNYGDERWEEQTGYSPSTLAAEIAGLVAAGAIANAHGDSALAHVYQATADSWQRSVKGWTVTTTGPYAGGRYFIRLSKAGDPNATTTYNLGNGGPSGVDQRRVIDAGFLELARFGELPASDPDIVSSLGVVDSVLRVQTDSGPGFYRYGLDTPGTEDGYGDCWVADPTSCTPDGKPWSNGNTGSGHVWPLLDGERGEEQLQLGDAAGAMHYLWTMHEMTSGIGLIPEQVWEDPDLPASPFGTASNVASIGFVNGKPAGSASDITWAEAQELRLILDSASAHPVDQPAVVRARYVDAGPPAQVPLTVSAPATGTAVTTAYTTVSGTSTAGAAIAIEVTRTSATGTDDSRVVSTTAGPDGTFTTGVETLSGTNVITVTAATAAGGTGYARVSVTSNAVAPAPVSVTGGVGGSVPATLALTLGAPAAFGSFVPGVARDYTAALSADVVSTAGEGALSVSDPDPAAPGHLVNGSFVLPQALAAMASSAAGAGGAFTVLSSAPVTLLTYTGPVSHDAVAIVFRQSIGAADALRTGGYAKTLTFTLSTTTP
jgi:glucoamylase